MISKNLNINELIIENDLRTILTIKQKVVLMTISTSSESLCNYMKNIWKQKDEEIKRRKKMKIKKPFNNYKIYLNYI